MVMSYEWHLCLRLKVNGRKGDKMRHGRDRWRRNV